MIQKYYEWKPFLVVSFVVGGGAVAGGEGGGWPSHHRILKISLTLLLLVPKQQCTWNIDQVLNKLQPVNRLVNTHSSTRVPWQKKSNKKHTQRQQQKQQQRQQQKQQQRQQLSLTFLLVLNNSAILYKKQQRQQQQKKPTTTKPNYQQHSPRLRYNYSGIHPPKYRVNKNNNKKLKQKQQQINLPISNTAHVKAIDAFINPRTVSTVVH